MSCRNTLSDRYPGCTGRSELHCYGFLQPARPAQLLLLVTLVAFCIAPSAGDAQQARGGAVPVGTVRASAPAWAYPTSRPEAAPGPAPAATLEHVPGSSLSFSKAQTTDRFAVPDWHPDEHGKMPSVVSQGRKPSVYACAYCHLPNGAGRSENASLAGLPESYIIEQVNEMKSGQRRSSLPAMTAFMMTVAQAVTQEETRAAARYFAHLRPKDNWIRVVEADVVPTTHVIPINVLAPIGDGHTEALGNRIIEVPEDVTRTDLRDSQSGYVAYVPKGSIERGRVLVTTGGEGRTIACSSCHGQNLKGVGAIPSIASRSPSYIFRQLFDIRAGTRSGATVALMNAPVAHLTDDDMISIAAYLASLHK